MGGNDYNGGFNDMDACCGLREETHLSPCIQTLNAILGIKSPFPVHGARRKKEMGRYIPLIGKTMKQITCGLVNFFFLQGYWDNFVLSRKRPE